MAGEPTDSSVDCRFSGQNPDGLSACIYGSEVNYFFIFLTPSVCLCFHVCMFILAILCTTKTLTSGPQLGQHVAVMEGIWNRLVARPHPKLLVELAWAWSSGKQLRWCQHKPRFRPLSQTLPHHKSCICPIALEQKWMLIIKKWE